MLVQQVSFLNLKRPLLYTADQRYTELLKWKEEKGQSKRVQSAVKTCVGRIVRLDVSGMTHCAIRRQWILLAAVRFHNHTGSAPHLLYTYTQARWLSPPSGQGDTADG